MNSVARQCFCGWCIELALRCVVLPFRCGLASGIRIRKADPVSGIPEAPLPARMELTVVINALLDRPADLGLDPVGPYPSIKGVAFRSPAALPVEFTPA